MKPLRKKQKRTRRERVERGLILRKRHFAVSLHLSVMQDSNTRTLRVALFGKKGERTLDDAIAKSKRILARIDRDPDYRLVGEAEPYGAGRY